MEVYVLMLIDYDGPDSETLGIFSNEENARKAMIEDLNVNYTDGSIKWQATEEEDEICDGMIYTQDEYSGQHYSIKKYSVDEV